MNREQRIQHSRRICHKITRKVGEICPPGLGRWPRCWELIEAPADRFLDALARWEEGDTPETREDVELAAEALLAAWEEAGDFFRLLEGIPGKEVGHAHV